MTLEEFGVALRKESVDRNPKQDGNWGWGEEVALRKESVDRNREVVVDIQLRAMSLSARRAWIEITPILWWRVPVLVALRKESVDRNDGFVSNGGALDGSLSARRAWIEMR